MSYLIQCDLSSLCIHVTKADDISRAIWNEILFNIYFSYYHQAAVIEILDSNQHCIFVWHTLVDSKNL